MKCRRKYAVKPPPVEEVAQRVYVAAAVGCAAAGAARRWNCGISVSIRR